MLIDTPLRRALVALATAAVALVPTAPALAQTATATPAPVPAPAPVAPQIQVDQTLVDYGETLRLTVTGTPGARVELFGNGGRIRTVTLPASGEFAWELQPGDRTLFYAKVAGQQSGSVTVEVRRTVTIGVSQAGGVYTFRGRIARAEPFVQVTIARLDPVTGRVTGVTSTSTQADGSYTVSTRLPGGFAGYYALTGVNRSLLQPGRSRLYGLVVPSGPTAPAPPAAAAVSLDVDRAGDRYLFSGRLRPGRSVPVTLARVVDGRLVGVVGGRTGADGSYSFSLDLAPGTEFYRVLTAAANGVPAAVSRVYGLVVPAPRR